MHDRTLLSPILALVVAALPLAAACKKEKTPEASEPAPTEAPLIKEEPRAPATAPGAGFGAAAGTYEIDAVHSSAVFRINRFGVANFYGAFHQVTGTITLAEDPAESRIEVEIDAASVFTADKKRDTHLRSPDFFDAKQFPTMRFTSTGIEPAGESRYQVSGEMEIRGQKKPATAEVEYIGAGDSPFKDFRAGFEAVLTLNRHDFGVSFMEGAMSDEVRLIVAVEAVRK